MSDTARTVLVAGTASHVGKSTVVAGLCRLLADRGVDVAPFKAQNMSNNARAVPTSGADDATPAFGEIGISQYVQARAARIRPETDHNPVLLKPRGEGESQLVVNGEAIAHYAAGEYYEQHWETAREAARAAHARLAARHDVIVAEGAGSIAEINLHDRDLANVETARFADADILLVADVERGGVFASIVGTLELLPPDLRDRVVGVVVTKFRGDVSILEPGLDELAERTGVPVLGVIPYDDPGLPEEDSVSLPPVGERAIHGAEDGVSEADAVTIAVPRLPRISNATDTEPLAAEPGVRVAYVPLDDPLADADAVVLPGTKNTVDDLFACRAAGFDRAIRRFEGPVVGLCGGYQLLGEQIHNADVESATLTNDESATLTNDESATLTNDDASTSVEAFGLLPIETTFDADKRVVATELQLDANRAGPIGGGSGSQDGSEEPLVVAGYEIHMGETRAVGGSVDGSTARLATPFHDPDGERTGVALGAATDRVVGTYLHGLFENATIRQAFINAVRDHAGVDPEAIAGTREMTEVAEMAEQAGTDTGRQPAGGQPARTEHGSPYDRAADLVREHVDLGPLSLPSGDESA